ncbi:MAG: helix-turn-helix domain-containing protein [Hyphomicrobiaceae bacterium]|nr:helix-turn-helix domain-containing protein [Hyphomicrobiaceae bacterium]
MLALTATPDYGRDAATNVYPMPGRPHRDAPIEADPFSAAMPSVYAPREDLFLEGDDATHMCEVIEGVICAYRLLPDGHRHVVSFYFPGDLIGYCCSGCQSFSAQALTRVRVRRIPRSAISQMIETRPGFARRLLELASGELMMTREHLLCLAAKSAEARLAAFLLALSRRNADAGTDPKQVFLPMTRLDIGDYLGLTIETVSRTLSKFKRSGIIALPRTTSVLIRDEAALCDIAQS